MKITIQLMYLKFINGPRLVGMQKYTSEMIKYEFFEGIHSGDVNESVVGLETFHHHHANNTYKIQRPSRPKSK